MRKPWRVTVATDNGKIIELSISLELGQLYLGIAESQRPAEHLATFSCKTKSLSNLLDALVEASEQLDDSQPLHPEPLRAGGAL